MKTVVLGLIIPFIGTAAGAACVFFLKKDIAGERVLVLESDDVSLAKNRLGLTGEVKLSEIDINKLLMPQGKEKK